MGQTERVMNLWNRKVIRGARPMRFLFILVSLAIILRSDPAWSADNQADSVWSGDLIRAALRKPMAFDLLTELTQKIGGRPGGSPQAALAVEWGRRTMERLGFQNVRLEPVRVPH